MSVTSPRSPLAKLGLYPKPRTFKVMVLGQSGVGKSALVVRFITRRYIGEYDRSVEKVYTFSTVIDSEMVYFEILDSAGDPHESECQSLEANIRWADTFILMYSVTDQCSFDECHRLKFLINYNKRRRRLTAASARESAVEVPVVLVGSKVDLAGDHMVTPNEGQLSVPAMRHINCRLQESAVDVPVVLVGNKVDLAGDQMVTPGEGQHSVPAMTHINCRLQESAVDVLVVLVGNKVDLAGDRIVTPDEGQDSVPAMRHINCRLQESAVDVPVVLVGNKVDLAGDHMVTPDEGQHSVSAMRHINCRLQESAVDVPVVLVGNKVDLAGDHIVTPDQGQNSVFAIRHINCRLQESAVDVPVVLVGNKVDLAGDRMVTPEEGQRRSREIGCVCFHEISVRESIDQVWGVFRDARRFWRLNSKSPRMRRVAQSDCELHPAALPCTGAALATATAPPVLPLAPLGCSDVEEETEETSPPGVGSRSSSASSCELPFRSRASTDSRLEPHPHRERHPPAAGVPPRATRRMSVSTRGDNAGSY